MAYQLPILGHSLGRNLYHILDYHPNIHPYQNSVFLAKLLNLAIYFARVPYGGVTAVRGSDLGSSLLS